MSPRPAKPSSVTETQLRSLLDALELALVVWRPAAGARTLLYANRRATDELLGHGGQLPGELVEAARLHRELQASAALHARGLRVPSQRCRVRGDQWFVRTIALATEGLEALVCAREVMREAALLAELQQSFRLTNRQTDVLRHLLRGSSSPDIAAALQLSPGTVYKYKSELRQHLGVRTNLEVMLLADQIRHHRAGNP